MINNNTRNYLIFLKNKLKKKKIIKKSIVQNNQTNIKRIYYTNLKKLEAKKNNISQISGKKKSLKKKTFINRWELYKLYTENQIINYKK